jgi:hypothetical protein
LATRLLVECAVERVSISMDLSVVVRNRKLLSANLLASPVSGALDALQTSDLMIVARPTSRTSSTGPPPRASG